MSHRKIAALLAIPLILMAVAWALGGVVFNHSPSDLGGVVVVRPARAPASTPAVARPIGPSTRPVEPAAGGTSSPAPGIPGQTAPPDQPKNPGRTGATPVTNGPAPTAGDDDDDDDGIDDGTTRDGDSENDRDRDRDRDDDTDN